MPIEKRPTHPLPPNFVPSGGKPYKVRTNDDLGSVARANGITETDLLIYNFNTVNTAEINWYLRHHVGCVAATHDRKNWMFSSNANPGIIYLPPKTGWKRPAFASESPGKLSALRTPVGSIKHSGIWFGLGGQTGGSLFVIGKDTVEACLYSWDDYESHFWMNIDGWRFGPGLGASVGAVLVIATGVDKPYDLDGFPKDGKDFQANMGGRWSDIAKAAKALKAVQKIGSGAKLIDKTISLAEWEKLRDTIWNLYKTGDIDTKKLDVNVFGIPGAGVGLELSAYYGWGLVAVHSVSLKSK